MGVYTAATLSTREVVSEVVERVAPRLVTLVLPDLLPVPGPEGHFCRVVNGRLVVTVRNQGTAPAEPVAVREGALFEPLVNRPAPCSPGRGGPA